MRDITEIASTGVSLMPEGVEKALTPQELADLLELSVAGYFFDHGPNDQRGLGVTVTSSMLSLPVPPFRPMLMTASRFLPGWALRWSDVSKRTILAMAPWCDSREVASPRRATAA